MRACLRVMVHINTATVIWKLCTRIHTWGFGVRGKRREGGSWHKLGFTLLRQLRVALEGDRRTTRAEADKPSRQALHMAARVVCTEELSYKQSSPSHYSQHVANEAASADFTVNCFAAL